MLRIGYVRGRPAESGDASGDGGGAARLSRAGCAVVHTEACGRDAAVLDSILGAIDAGDELVVTRLEHLGDSGRAVLEVLRRLEGRGAALRVLDPRLSSRGPGGPALRAALEAVAALEPLAGTRPRRPAAPEEIRDLQRAGVGPVEIARRLGVSRMTVWRKLKALEGCA
ncbi:MAG TPA: recombinase family protein [Phenylobacterium sp.]|jgi:DNA invertase Pin-like site-specific DNA recombinase|uniref:recombinase family protein n=1 Tax=Phenylobacterium sp. TaxID=1871053 RepID=UPI002CB88D97|nr:recombinase family protein [Phenylobacterium sp.]HXA38919.1 recombinase family protein [Phenylobacterium sp.]